MREQAQAESERILQQAHQQVEAERRQVVQQLRTEVGTMATTLAGRIVGESLEDDERRDRTVERFLATSRAVSRPASREPADASGSARVALAELLDDVETTIDEASSARLGERAVRASSPCSTRSRRCAGR